MLDYADRAAARDRPVGARLGGEDRPVAVGFEKVSTPTGPLSMDRAMESLARDFDREVEAWLNDAHGGDRAIFRLNAFRIEPRPSTERLGGPDLQIALELLRDHPGEVVFREEGGRVVLRDHQQRQFSFPKEQFHAIMMGQLEERAPQGIASLSLHRVTDRGRPLDDWKNDIRGVPQSPRETGLRELELSIEPRRGEDGVDALMRNLGRDVWQWGNNTQFAKWRTHTDEIYTLEVSRPDQIGGRRLAIHVSQDEIDPTENSPAACVYHIRSDDGTTHAVKSDDMAAWLREHLGEDPGTLRLTRETGPLRIETNLSNPLEPRSDYRVREHELADLEHGIDRLEAIAKSTIGRPPEDIDDLKMALRELAALRAAVQMESPGREARWEHEPRYEEGRQAILAEVDRQAERFTRLLRERGGEPDPVPQQPDPLPRSDREPRVGGVQVTDRGEVVPIRLRPLEDGSGLGIPGLFGQRTAKGGIPTYETDREALLWETVVERQAQRLGAETVDFEEETVSSRLAERAGRGHLQLTLGGETASMDDPDLPGRIGSLPMFFRTEDDPELELAGSAGQVSGFSRFLDDSEFESVFDQALRRLYPPGTEADYRVDVAVEALRGGDGLPLYEITFRAPLPPGLQTTEGRIDAPVLAMTLRVPLQQLPEQHPQVELRPPRLEVGQG
ncbi:MAG: hypothetical protein U1E53_15885 [Dongiaceae bacterium]